MEPDTKYYSQGESQHRTSKGRFERTNKTNFTGQLANIERRESRLRDISDALSRSGVAPAPSRRLVDSKPNFEEALPEQHNYVARSQRDPIHIPTWVHAQGDDPAALVDVKHFYLPT